jgi:hypothetical protein
MGESPSLKPRKAPPQLTCANVGATAGLTTQRLVERRHALTSLPVGARATGLETLWFSLTFFIFQSKELLKLIREVNER